MRRLVLVAAVALLGLAATTPAGACAADGDPCLHDTLVATVEGETWVDYDADGLRDGDERDRVSERQLYADYNHDGVRQNGETLVFARPDGSYALPVDTRRLDSDSVDVRLAYLRMPDRPQFESDCTGHPGCVQTVEVRTGETRGAVDFPVVASAHVHGLIWDDKNDDGRRQAGEDGVRGLRVFLDDDNDAQLDPGELETRSLADGRYRLQIPTRYQLAGGALPPLVLERTTGVACSGPLDCTVYGLRTRSTEDTPAAHGVSRAAVIFVHGLGGSRIACGPGRMDLMDLRLGADGRGLRVSDGGTVCSQNAMDDGLVDQDASRHFEAITWPGRHYDYVWDWRRSPEDAVDGLDALVARVRAETGVAKVQLVGHASGGLVIRHYIADDARARKIQRAVTVGTPYWGAPKAILPLVAGDQDVMAATRTFPGHFALLPAFGYGSWLTVNGGRQLDLEGVEEYLRRIGVHPSLFVRAVSEHGRVLDHYEDHGVDFHVIAGGGLPTIAAVALRGGPISDEAALSWASGDETVPAVAAMHDTPRDNLHRVCGVANAALMTAPQTTALIDAFIVRGEPIRDAHQSCPWSARELALYDPAAPATAAAVSEPRVIAGGRSLPLADAERAGLVQVVTFGASTRVVARVGTDVRVELPAGGTATVRDLAETGAGLQRRFGPLTGTTTVELGGSGAVTRAGRAVRPAARDAQAPVTRAALRPAGRGRVRLTLRARDASGVAATYVIVDGRRRVYRRAIVLRAKRVAYGSVDIWGNAERVRTLRRRGHPCCASSGTAPR